jgi:hypothetical protein
MTLGLLTLIKMISCRTTKRRIEQCVLNTNAGKRLP